LGGIAWVIVGGESGFGARPMERDWVLGIRQQCIDSRVPFFFKQWGGVRKSEAGRMLDGRTYDEMLFRLSQNSVTQSVRLQLIEQVKGWQLEHVA
jgi:protein gp37